MSKKDKDNDNIFDQGFQMEIDGRTMSAMDADEMPEHMGMVFKALMGNGADLIETIHRRTGLGIEQCFQLLLAAQGALYARMSHVASKGNAPKELGDWKGNDEEGIEDMVRTFRVNARQIIDGINPNMRKDNLQ